MKLKRMSKDQMMQQAVEILTALKKLGEEVRRDNTYKYMCSATSSE